MDARERRDPEGLRRRCWSPWAGDRCVCRIDTGQEGIGGHSSFPGGFIEIWSRCYTIHLLKWVIQSISIDLWSPQTTSWVSYFCVVTSDLTVLVAGSKHCWSLWSGFLPLLSCLLFLRLSVLDFLSGFHFYYSQSYHILFSVRLSMLGAMMPWAFCMQILASPQVFLPPVGGYLRVGLPAAMVIHVQRFERLLNCLPVSTPFNICSVLPLSPLTPVGGRVS